MFCKSGEDIFRDNGSHLSLKKDITDHGVKAAHMIAMARFNEQAIVVNGTDELKAKCVEVSAKDGLSLAFADPGMERKRQQRLSTEGYHNSIQGNTPGVWEKRERHERDEVRRKTLEMTR